MPRARYIMYIYSLNFNKLYYVSICAIWFPIPRLRSVIIQLSQSMHAQWMNGRVTAAAPKNTTTAQRGRGTFINYFITRARFTDRWASARIYGYLEEVAAKRDARRYGVPIQTRLKLSVAVAAQPAAAARFSCGGSASEARPRRANNCLLVWIWGVKAILRARSYYTSSWSA